ncbi:Ig-like domain-containing protein [uncultured Massilia sp.]|uniref:Ig-like domain-containing protein n=1 Tax=uncultured Massilia sp. TaxID=169973 RepID=UPI0025D2BFFE|nr:Ig-like domain-containing protein [uncultured Massilia sp.]
MPQPSYSSASGYISENFITISFSLPLDSANPPPASAFDLQLNGTGVTVTGVTVDSAAQTVTVTINSFLLAGDIVDFVYTDPSNGNDAKAIQGLDGTDSASFSHSTIVAIGRPGPAAPAAPTLDAGSDSGVAGDRITNDATPTLYGIADANATVKLYDTDGTTLLGTYAADSGGKWNITSLGLKDGDHTLRVTQTDGSGATSTLSQGITLTIDTGAAAPSNLALTSGTDSGAKGDGITNVTQPRVSGLAEANAAVSLYDTDGTTLLGSTTADGGGKWQILSDALKSGTHQLTATQTDVAGNLSAASATFTVVVDTTGPTAIALSATSARKDHATNGSTVSTLSSTDITAVQYDFAVGDGVNDADNGKFTISGNSLVAAQNLSAGTYHLYLSATDAAGNAAYDVFSFTVTDAPSVSEIARVGAATVPAADGSVAYTVTFDQAVTGVDKTAFVLSASGNASGTIDTVTGSGTTYTVTVKDVAGDGMLRLDVLAGSTIQNAGGTPLSGGYTAGAFYTLDHTAPLAPTALAAKAADDSGASSVDGISSVKAPHISGHGEADATIKLYDTDGTTLLGSVTADGSGNWDIPSIALDEGKHTLTAVQVDAAGNKSVVSAGFDYTVDTTAPTAIALSRATLPITQAGSGATVATLAATDAHAVTFALVAAPSGNADADNARFTVSGTGLVAAQNLAPGVYHVYVQATDAAGNSSPKGLTFEVIDAPHVASVERAGAADPLAPAAATTVTYTVTFDQAVTGVDKTAFVLSASGNANGTIDTVTGSGTTYTVTVKDVAGDGTLRLDVLAGNTIQNAGGTPLSGDYTTGQTFSLDHTAPAAVAGFAILGADDTGRLDTDGITNVAAPRISGSGEANATIKLYDTDGTTLLGQTTADGSGKWTISSSALDEGQHTLTVRQTDAAGNVSAASAGLTVTIDTTATPPAAPALAPASDSGTIGDGITSVRTPTLVGSAEALAAVRLYDTDGTTLLGSTVADASGKWSIVSSALADAVHTLTVTQTDVAGNVSLASKGLQLTVDGTAPLAPAAPSLDAASDTGTRGDGITETVRPVLSGTAEANARVTLYDSDGKTVVATAVADGAGHWSATSATLALGEHRLSATQADAAGNVSLAGAALTLTIVPPPQPPATFIDGTPVTQQTISLPGGLLGTQTTVPIVVADRTESSGSAGVADIPLAAGNGANLLLAQVPTGFGLSSTGGASQAGAGAAEQLIQAIRGATPDHSATDQGHLTGNGQSFLDLLPATVPLLVQTVTPVTGAGTSGATLTLAGTSSATQHTALVIDAAGVGAGNTIMLKAVDFAAVIGAATVGGATAGQVITGDAAAQTVTVGAGQASSVFAGGGADVLQLGAPGAGSDAGAGSSAATRGAAATLLHGGQGTDTAVFAGDRSAYAIEEHDGHLVVTALGGNHDQALVVNVETLRFGDGDVAVQNRAALSTIAGLYADVLGRQADVDGFAFWGAAQKAGATLGTIAVAMIGTAEGQAHQAAFSGDAAHDVGVLYQALFGRAADAGGAAFWLDAMQHGASLQQVADGMLQSVEIVGHALGAAQWDFTV